VLNSALDRKASQIGFQGQVLKIFFTISIWLIQMIQGQVLFDLEALHKELDLSHKALEEKDQAVRWEFMS
jgi:hypothetical protein